MGEGGGYSSRDSFLSFHVTPRSWLHLFSPRCQPSVLVVGAKPYGPQPQIHSTAGTKGHWMFPGPGPALCISQYLPRPRLPHPEATSIRHLPRPGPGAAGIHAEALLAWASLLHRALRIGQTDFLLELNLPRLLHIEMNCRIPCLADTGGLRTGKYHIC